MPKMHFADRLMRAILEKESQVMVGLDPRIDRLPSELAPRQEELTAESCARAVVEFNRAVIDAVADYAVAVKPQIAFYERFGSRGVAAYAETISHARDRGLLVIGDVKRNDISSTAAAYAAGHLGPSDGSPNLSDFTADAVTINPYLGADGVLPFLESAEANGGGAFALVKTSNPSSIDLQDVECSGRRLYEHVAELVEHWGELYRGESAYSALGAVVGATYPEGLRRLRELMPHAPFLVPGFGAQGGGVQDVAGAFDEDGLGAVVNSSRGIIFAWQREPYDADYGPDRWREAVRAAAADMRRELWSATH
jgi:orotidine-5'-phosphate decarboxylase